MSAATQLPEDADTLSGTPSPGPSTDTRSRPHFRRRCCCPRSGVCSPTDMTAAS